MSALPSLLVRLWTLAGGRPEDPACDWNTTFDPVGLILTAPPKREEYWCTPLNSITFARTGGDGVHFGLVATGGVVTDFSPVVMTVPMSGHPNVVVGSSFKEFLSLGCRFGYFGLEQLVHTPEETFEALESAEFDPETTGEELALLRQLCREFGLKPWSRPRERLRELRALHWHQLEIPPQEPGDAS